MPNHVNDGGGEDGDRKKAIIKGVDAACDEGIGVNFLAGVFDEKTEGKFDNDAGDEDDDSDGTIFGSFGVDEFFDGLSEGGDAGVEDDGGNYERSNVFNSTMTIWMIAVGGFTGKFSANDGNDTGEGVA